MRLAPDLVVWTYSDSNELLVKHDPREQVDEGDVGGEESHDLGAAEVAEGVDVEVIGQDPEQAEENATSQEFAWNMKTSLGTTFYREQECLSIQVWGLQLDLKFICIICT